LKSSASSPLELPRLLALKMQDASY
jgi:hypothetical protein